MMTDVKVYYDDDADLQYLEDKTIGVIGYGNQGRAQALNMRDSGLEDVIIGNRRDDFWDQARVDEFDVYPISEAARRANVLLLLVPDEVAPDVFTDYIESHLEEDDVLNFASGYNVTFGAIHPPTNVDVTLMAPRMIGEMVRALYEDGHGSPALLAVGQDHSGNAREIALAIGKAIGATRSGVIEATFDMETKTDLLTEQGLFPVILSALLAKYEVEVEEGIPPEIVLTEGYLSRELSYVFKQMSEIGILGQMPLHSGTSQYGQLSRLDRMREGKFVLKYDLLKKYMRDRLDDISSGRFVKEWALAQEKDGRRLKELYGKYERSEFIKDEQRTLERLGLRKK